MHLEIQVAGSEYDASYENRSRLGDSNAQILFIKDRYECYSSIMFYAAISIKEFFKIFYNKKNFKLYTFTGWKGFF